MPLSGLCIVQRPGVAVRYGMGTLFASLRTAVRPSELRMLRLQGLSRSERGPYSDWREGLRDCGILSHDTISVVSFQLLCLRSISGLTISTNPLSIAINFESTARLVFILSLLVKSLKLGLVKGMEFWVPS